MNLPVHLPIAESGISYAYMNSDIVGQGICIILLIASVIMWVIMLEKCFTLRHAIKDIDRFSRRFQEKKSPRQLRDVAESDPSPAARIYQAAMDRIDELNGSSPDGRIRALSDDELTVVKDTMSQAVEKQLTIMEKRTIILATAVSGSPFLGLFGTVWGITIAFTNLAIQGRADIQTLAPGVSGALLTTVIALFVAIPSLMGYNYVNALLKEITVRMDNFVDEIAARFKIEQVESYRNYQEHR